MKIKRRAPTWCRITAIRSNSTQTCSQGRSAGPAGCTGGQCPRLTWNLSLDEWSSLVPRIAAIGWRPVGRDVALSSRNRCVSNICHKDQCGRNRRARGHFDPTVRPSRLLSSARASCTLALRFSSRLRAPGTAPSASAGRPAARPRSATTRRCSAPGRWSSH